MKILITGANGMLADELCPLLADKGYEVIATDVKGTQKDEIQYLDICDFGSVDSFVEKSRPDMIMHLAAETDVDKCETEKKHAFRVNAHATQNIADICKRLDILLVYISTAAVFDGGKEMPYVETDRTNPLSIYAKSKLEGEEAVRGTLKRYFIVRAGWMIGGIDKDKKFVAKILKILKDKNKLNVVNDKFGSPTFTKDFVRGLLELIKTDRFNTYHMANIGGCSRFEIAKKIVEYMGRRDVTVSPVSSDMFPLPAPRGRSEVVENRRLEELGINNMRPWQDALKEYVLEWKRRKGI